MFRLSKTEKNDDMMLGTFLVICGGFLCCTTSI